MMVLPSRRVVSLAAALISGVFFYVVLGVIVYKLWSFQ